MKAQSIYNLKLDFNFEYNGTMYAYINDGRMCYLESAEGKAISPIETQIILKERE